jgi:hypothetical protein
VRYLTLAEALVIAEAVTGLDPKTLAMSSRLELLDSALHAPAGRVRRRGLLVACTSSLLDVSVPYADRP